MRVGESERAEIVAAARRGERGGAGRLGWRRRGGAPRAPVRVLRGAAGAADHGRHRRAGERGATAVSSSLTTRAIGSAPRSTWTRWSSAITGCSACCTRLRSCAVGPRASRSCTGSWSAHGSGWAPVTRRLTATSSNGVWPRASSAREDGSFAVSPRPHRGLCLTCPGRAGLCSWEESETLREDPEPLGEDREHERARGGQIAADP